VAETCAAAEDNAPEPFLISPITRVRLFSMSPIATCKRPISSPRSVPIFTRRSPRATRSATATTSPNGSVTLRVITMLKLMLITSASAMKMLIAQLARELWRKISSRVPFKFSARKICALASKARM
jgi:hypothetical protein